MNANQAGNGPDSLSLASLAVLPKLMHACTSRHHGARRLHGSQIEKEGGKRTKKDVLEHSYAHF